MWTLLIAVLVIALGCYWYYIISKPVEIVDVRGKTVFISGCDTGFGQGIALRLDAIGMKVFAGCLTEEGIRVLSSKASPELIPLKCDITNDEDIEHTVRIVTKFSSDGLWALINNAGIWYSGEWDWLPMQYVRRTMEVNFFGHVAVTRAFLPLLKKAKGRVVNLTSLAGVISYATSGAYCSSKYAMEAFSDSLRREMKKWGISVSVIEPGMTNTPMLRARMQSLEKIWNELSDDVKIAYGEEYRSKIMDDKFLTAPIDPPTYVLNELQAAVINKHPPTRTQVGFRAKKMTFISTFFPTFVMDWYMAYLEKQPIPAVLLNKT